jgi:hypothetical protein
MNGLFLKIMLVLMLLVIAATGCSESAMSSNHNMSAKVDHWEMTPAGVYVARY